MPKEKKKAGRPAHSPGDIKRHPLNMRTTKVLRDRLEAEADLSGRSLAQEVEFRLEQSFLDDDATKRAIEASFGGRSVFSLFQIFASAKALIEKHTKKEMKDDWETYHAIQHAWQQVASAFAPKKPDDRPSIPPTSIYEPGGLLGSSIDETFLEANRASLALGDAAANVLLDNLAKAMKKPKQAGSTDGNG